MRHIPLKNGYSAYVDDCDYDRITRFGQWRRNKRGYAICYKVINGKRHTFYMHRLVMRAQPGQQVDHIDRDKLNNVRRNLRFCTRSQNQANKGLQRNNATGVKGVTWRRNRYEVRIRYHSQNLYLGRYERLDEATRVRDVAAEYLFGEFAWLNQPTNDDNSIEFQRFARQVIHKVNAALGR